MFETEKRGTASTPAATTDGGEKRNNESAAAPSRPELSLFTGRELSIVRQATQARPFSTKCRTARVGRRLLIEIKLAARDRHQMFLQLAGVLVWPENPKRHFRTGFPS